MYPNLLNLIKFLKMFFNKIYANAEFVLHLVWMYKMNIIPHQKLILPIF